MEKYLIHSNELHLIDAEKIHQAVEKMVESLDLAAGSTTNFDLYQVVENYFKDLEKRRKINHVLGIKEDRYELAEISALNKRKKFIQSHQTSFPKNERAPLNVKLPRFFWNNQRIIINFPDVL